MKRFGILFLIFALVLSLAACSGAPAGESSSAPVEESFLPSSSSEAEQPAASSENPSVPEETPVLEEAAEPDPDSNILIAYFTAAENSEVDAVASASVVTIGDIPMGQVQAVAGMIQSETEGELFSIQTSVEYPGDYGPLLDYAAIEQDENVRPELTTHIENLDQYDTIFVGYPNWWGDLPMVLYSFFDEYDFAGKTVIPFISHNGSGASNTFAMVAELEPEANVVTDGFVVSERNIAQCAEDVASWLDGLGY